jgi:hypothetical protein
LVPPPDFGRFGRRWRHNGRVAPVGCPRARICRKNSRNGRGTSQGAQHRAADVRSCDGTAASRRAAGERRLRWQRACSGVAKDHGRGRCAGTGRVGRGGGRGGCGCRNSSRQRGCWGEQCVRGDSPACAMRILRFGLVTRATADALRRCWVEAGARCVQGAQQQCGSCGGGAGRPAGTAPQGSSPAVARRRWRRRGGRAISDAILGMIGVWCAWVGLWYCYRGGGQVTADHDESRPHAEHRVGHSNFQ